MNYYLVIASHRTIILRVQAYLFFGVVSLDSLRLSCSADVRVGRIARKLKLARRLLSGFWYSCSISWSGTLDCPMGWMNLDDCATT